MKFKPMTISANKHATIIVGECPGEQRPVTNVCWENNRSANFLHNHVLYGLTNLVLTNASLYKKTLTAEALEEGARDLEKLILKYLPKKIILLGDTARQLQPRIREIYTGALYFFNHPSFVLRFDSKNKMKYAAKLRKAIEI